MHLKAFSAPSMSLAMARVREAMGQDAIIVSTRNGNPDGSVTVMAAVERAPFDGRLDGTGDTAGDPVAAIDAILQFHRTPREVAGPLMAAAGGLSGSNHDLADPVALLAGALDMQVAFRTIDFNSPSGPIVVVGSPGCGKSVACAKIAVAAKRAGKAVRLVTAGTPRPGATARLHALATDISVSVEDATDHPSLARLSVPRSGEIVIVDTAGVNPLDEGECAGLGAWLKDLHADVLLSVPAGSDAFDAAEQANTFAARGATGLFASRLDSSTRYGGLLAAAMAARLPFTLSSIHPQVADGLVPLNPVSLARLLVARHEGAPSPFENLVEKDERTES
jgi:flagellar biosynthesis protein FlhF